MSEFSEKMKEAIKKSRFTMPYLSEMSGLSVPNLYKICQGKRLPKEKEKMIALIQALQCPKSEELSLIQEYQIELFGKNEYYSLLAMRELFSQLGRTKKSSLFYSATDKCQDASVLYGKTECSAYLQQCFARELQKQNDPVIRMIGGENSTCFHDCIRMLPEHSGVTCRHILRLDSRSTPGSNLANLRLMTRALPWAFGSTSYLPFYYYEYGEVRDNRIQLFHSAVLLADQAVLFLADYDHAVILRDQKQRKLLEYLFDSLLAESEPMVQKISSLSGWHRMLERLAPEIRRRPAYLLQWNLCALSVADEEMLRSSLKSPEPESAVLEMMERRSVSEQTQAVCYVTREGLEEFVQTGRLEYLPQCMYRPLELEDRLTVLERLREAWTGENRFYFLNERKFVISRQLFVESCSESDSMIGFLEDGEPFQVFLQNEKGMAFGAYQFLRYIEHSDYVYSREESWQYLEDAITEVREKLQKK